MTVQVTFGSVRNEARHIVLALLDSTTEAAYNSAGPPLAIVPRNELRPAPQAEERALRDAALMAYREETGGTAMGWPLGDADQDSHEQHRRKTAHQRQAATPNERPVRPYRAIRYQPEVPARKPAAS
jgi:hypothetical protein